MKLQLAEIVILTLSSRVGISAPITLAPLFGALFGMCGKHDWPTEEWHEKQQEKLVEKDVSDSALLVFAAVVPQLNGLTRRQSADGQRRQKGLRFSAHNMSIIASVAVPSIRMVSNIR